MNNPSDQQHQIVDCSREIHTKLKENKSRQFFEAILQSSGFRKSRDNQRWIFDTNLLNHLQRMYQFWSIWDLTNVSSNDTMQEFIDDGYSIEEAKLAIELSLHDPQTQMNKNIEIEQQSLDHIDEINELMSMGFTVEEARMAINFSMNDAKQTVSQEMIVPEKIQFSTELTELMQSELVDKVDSSYLFNNSNICTEKCQSNLKQCHNFIRIKKILYKYKLFTNDTKPNINDIYDGDYGNTDLLNDFNHLMFYHSNEFEDIYNLLSKQCNNNTPCDASKCIMLRRSHRDRFADNKKANALYNTSNNYEIVKQQFLDRLHSYFFHSFDMGYKMTQKEKQMILSSSTIDNSESKNNNEDVNICNLINEKKQTRANINEMSATNNKHNKFTMTIDEKEGEVYSFGFRYFYWDYYKESFMTNDPVKQQKEVDEMGPSFNFAANAGYRLRDWYISKKYHDLKHELLNNGICFIMIRNWDQLLGKARDHIESSKCRELDCARTNEFAIWYEMKFGDPMTTNHLIAMMVYCNYDNLQFEFSQTFRFLHQCETDEQMKERHRNYYFLGRYLRECVECFGMNFRRSVNGAQDLHFQLYHGISQCFEFSSVNSCVNGPLSTTQDSKVAVTFCHHNGMILEIDIDAYYWVFKHSEMVGHYFDKRLNCFDCRWLSDFANEEEIFFVGGISQFSFNTIIDVLKGEDYSLYVKGLKNMTCFMNNGITQYEDNVPSTQAEFQMVFRLLSHQIWKVFPNEEHAHEFTGCPQYFKNVMQKHCHNIIEINFCWHQRQIQSKVHKLLLKDKNGWIKLNLLTTLFPNTRHILCNGSDENNAIIKPSIIVESIFAFLERNINTKLEQITIQIHGKFYEFMRSEIDKCRDELYNKYQWIIFYNESELSTLENVREVMISINVRNMKRMPTLL